MCKIGVLIPDRGDRPMFRKHCEYLLAQQTLKPAIIRFEDEPPTSEEVDITVRYRTGYNALSSLDLDVIAFMENDDWYAPNYLEAMRTGWVLYGRPDIFGTNKTIYYHIGLMRHLTMYHDSRSSAMNTFIKPGLNFVWPRDNDPYTDLWLWKRLQGKTHDPGETLSIGIKHGVGKCGGWFHDNKLDRFTNADQGFLKRTVDPVSFKLYSDYAKDFNNTPHQVPA